MGYVFGIVYHGLEFVTLLLCCCGILLHFGEEEFYQKPNKLPHNSSCNPLNSIEFNGSCYQCEGYNQPPPALVLKKIVCVEKFSHNFFFALIAVIVSFQAYLGMIIEGIRRNKSCKCWVFSLGILGILVETAGIKKASFVSQ